MESTSSELKKTSIKTILSEITVPSNCIDEEYLVNPLKYINALEKSGRPGSRLIRAVKVLKKEMFILTLSKYLKAIDCISEVEREDFYKSECKRNIVPVVFIEDIKEKYLEIVFENYKKFHKMTFDIDLYKKRRSQLNDEWPVSA